MMSQLTLGPEYVLFQGLISFFIRFSRWCAFSMFDINRTSGSQVPAILLLFAVLKRCIYGSWSVVPPYHLIMPFFLRIMITASIYNSSNLCVCVCVSVCLRLPFLDDRRSDLIETCQEYCRGPADVPFQGLILIGRAVPKLRPFYCFLQCWKSVYMAAEVSFHLITLSCHFFSQNNSILIIIIIAQ